MPDEYALMFPGQGAQYVGMGKELLNESQKAKDVFDRASEALGFNVKKMCTEGPEEKLNLTEYTQPALLTASIAVWEALSAHDIDSPEMAAGLSLGEYTALVAANSLTLEDAVVLVRKRGKYMQEAVPAGQGGMAAIIGLDDETVREVCEKVENEENGVLAGANFNCPGQVVISGHDPLVKLACEVLKEKGAKRALELPVSAPFHTSLMDPAREKLAEAMSDVDIDSPDFPVVSNAWAEPLIEPADIRQALLEQVSSPVLWNDGVVHMKEAGISTFVEAGPGKSLRGFLRRIDRGLRGLGCETPEEICNVAEDL